MLPLNHVNLPVAEVGALRDFFVRHFRFIEVATRGRDALVVLHGADGFVLTLMRAAPADAGAYPRNFHVGFYVDGADQVRATQTALRAAGVETGEVEALTRGGFSSVTFYCHAPGGVLVEVSSASDAPDVASPEEAA